MYGLQCWNASGVLTFDSTQAAGAVPIGFYSGGAGVLSFPQYAGLQIHALTITGVEFVPSGSYLSISYAPGYPVVTVAADAPTFLLAVF